MNFMRNLFGKDQKNDAPLPSAEILDEAKKIFFEYSCNGLHMAQNDVNFSQYHISKGLQAEWRNEFIAYWRSRLSTEDLTAIRKLTDATAVEVIPDLLAMVDQGDSYTRLRIAEALRALSYKLDTDKNLKKHTKETAIKLAQSILDRPIQISESHKIEITHYGSSNPEQYIITFAKNAADKSR